MPISTALKTVLRLWLVLVKNGGLANGLSFRGAVLSNIPPLEALDGSFVTDPVGKANLLATTFAQRRQLPAVSRNAFSASVVGSLPVHGANRLPIRSRAVFKILKVLRVDSGTGPDHIPTRILKFCAAVFISFCMLV